MNSNLKTSIFNPEDKLSERIETETLYVPFVEKDSAKELGARWDPATKSWVCDIQNKSLMDKYRKRYIQVEYKDKDKSYGLQIAILPDGQVILLRELQNE